MEASVSLKAELWLRRGGGRRVAGTPLLHLLLSPAAQTAHIAVVSWQHKGEGSAVSLLIVLPGLEEAEAGGGDLP